MLNSCVAIRPGKSSQIEVSYCGSLSSCIEIKVGYGTA